jgi:hypothetical protein
MVRHRAHSNAENIPRKVWIFEAKDYADMLTERGYLNFYAKFESTEYVGAVFATKDRADTDIRRLLQGFGSLLPGQVL